MNKKEFKKIGRLVKARRLRAQLSQTELAKRVGVSKPTICNLEHGSPTVAPVWYKMIAIAKVLGIGRDRLWV